MNLVSHLRDNWYCLPPIKGQSCLVQLGRFGDIINVLPIAQEMLRMTGMAPAFCCAKEFASVLDGVGYVQPEIWDGPFNIAAPAVRAMSGRYGCVRVSQVLAKDTKWEAATPSYSTDSWLRAGFLRQWGDLPLVFDKRNKEREALLIEKFKPDAKTVLLALEGKNSPVDEAADIAWWLSEMLDGWKVVNLHGFRAQRIFDMLGLMDAAGVLVAIDSALLHLAAASPIKTIALIADTLTPWQGTKPRCNVIGSLKYSEAKDLDATLPKIVQWIEHGKDDGPVEIKPASKFPSFLEQTKWKCGLFELPAEPGVTWFNPSIAEWGGTLWFAVRRCSALPRGASRRTDGPGKGAGPNTIEIFSIDEAKQIVHPQPVGFCINYPQECYEDPRLCILGGELAVSYGNIYGKAWQKLAFTSKDGVYTPAYGNNRKPTGMEKNWIWFDLDGELYFVYRGWPHEVVKVKNGEPDDFWIADESRCPWQYGEIHGGTPPVLVEDLFWTFFHSRVDGQNPRGRYYMGAYAFENKPPFRIVAMTMKPLLVGSELDGGDLPVVFPGGAILRKGVWLIALGINDHRSAWLEIPHNDLSALVTRL